MKEKVNIKTFNIDPKIKDGYYSDAYFNRTREILIKDNYHPIVKMQIFQRNDNVCVCGINEVIAILKESLGNDFKKIKIYALKDGDIVNAWETVMIIEGDYSIFAHLETVYLGVLARSTRISTNVYRCVKESNKKPILFFPARFDSYRVQQQDGYAYKIGNKAGGLIENIVSTNAQGEWYSELGSGTIPHGLIAAYKGDTVKAALKFAEYMPEEIKRIVLVDYDNDCVSTTLKVAEAMHKKYMETKDKRYKLFAVRLDTSGNMIDKSITKFNAINGLKHFGGVNPLLVKNVYNALQKQSYKNISIIVSGGFDIEKIKHFEALKLPVIAYGVGSSIFSGNFDFTADIVQIKDKNKWIDNSKKGRTYNPNKRLKINLFKN